MRISAELTAFTKRLGHEFARPELLHEALTHGSFADGARADNQRLEFLGDRVLGLAIAEALLDADPGANEGRLAPRLNALVRKETCADVARELGLGEVLRLGRSEMLSGGRRKVALLGDAMEAVIAAVYLDAGYDRAGHVITRLWADRIRRVDDDAKDPKTTLQEWAQSRAQPVPDYELIKREGPAHAPVFHIRVTVDGRSASAAAGTKRLAEHEAARSLLEQLESDSD